MRNLQLPKDATELGLLKVTQVGNGRSDQRGVIWRGIGCISSSTRLNICVACTDLQSKVWPTAVDQPFRGRTTTATERTPTTASNLAEGFKTSRCISNVTLGTLRVCTQEHREFSSWKKQKIL